MLNLSVSTKLTWNVNESVNNDVCLCEMEGSVEVEVLKQLSASSWIYTANWKKSGKVSAYV